MKFKPSYFGLDISSWEFPIDFQKMYDYGTKFIILRAGVGKQIDKDFMSGWKSVKDVKIPRGAYWYYLPNYSPDEQANLAISLLKYDLPEGRFYLDLEYSNSGDYDKAKYLIQFLEKIESIGIRCGIYTGYYWWKDHFSDAEKKEFAKWPLWLPWYDSSLENVKIPYPWDDCIIWQSGTPAIGKDVGANTNEIDYNIWNGYYDFINEWKFLPNNTNGETSMSVKTGIVSAQTLNVRSGKGTTFPVIASLIKGDTVFSDFQSDDGWWHITNAARNGVDIYTFNGELIKSRQDCWISGRYINETSSQPTLPNFEITIDISDSTGQYKPQNIKISLEPK
jgi:GH25 family lysozyme M1 (1,4-beta-N-acetylmuramidase)